MTSPNRTPEDKQPKRQEDDHFQTSGSPKSVLGQAPGRKTSIAKKKSKATIPSQQVRWKWDVK